MDIEDKICKLILTTKTHTNKMEIENKTELFLD